MSKTQITHEEAAAELLRGKQVMAKSWYPGYLYKFVETPGELSHLAVFYPDGRDFGKMIIGNGYIPNLCAEAAQRNDVTFWTEDNSTQEQA